MKTPTCISSELFTLSLSTIVLAFCQLSIAQDAWRALSDVNAPTARILLPNTAIWTGNEMIIWGSSTGAGQATVLDDGATYNPATDSWTTMSTTGAPGPRVAFSTVWTGTEMIVWGGGLGPGVNYGNGARFNPSQNTWAAMSMTGAPSPRQGHVAVWTGTEMIVWGGSDTYGSVMFGDGARYNPVTDTWLPMSSVGAPVARSLSRAVWTGTQMIIWGGASFLTQLNDGARYNPVTDTWSPVQSIGAPTARANHNAIWTGSEMIICGGQPPSNSGARYNPVADTWIPISTNGMPSARANDTAVWTGSEMILWGGITSDAVTVNDGAGYEPASDSWTPLGLIGAPAPRHVHAAVWTGDQMIIWGGSSNAYLGAASGYLNDTYGYVPPSPAGPSISSFSPTTGPASTVVTITGSNFGTTPGENIVYFGAVRATVTTANSTQLTALVPAGATYAPITVTTAGLTASSQSPFLVTFPDCGVLTSNSFAARQDFTVGTQPYTFGLGDIDGDGLVDMAVGLHNSSSIAFFRNTSSAGAISFSPAGSVNVGGSGNTILYPTFADLDGDGKLDLIAANWGTHKVVVFRNTSLIGDFSFEARTDLAVGIAPYAVAVGDLDHDGRLDIVSANSGSATVSVMRNVCTPGVLDGSSFEARQDFATDFGPNNIVLGDIDGDGFLDIVTCNSSDFTISILRNGSSNGNISFETHVDFSTAGNPNDVAIGDLDGDGKSDIVVGGVGTMANDTGVFVHRNRAEVGSITPASLAEKVCLVPGSAAPLIDLTDVNGDGKLDVIATLHVSPSGTIAVLQNIASAGSLDAGSFEPPMELMLNQQSPFYAYDIRAADLDLDGRTDLLATWDQNTGYATVYRNLDCASPPSQPPSIVDISIPVGSQNYACRPSYDNVWEVSAPPCPFNVNSGIGIIVNPTVQGGNDNHDFALHQNDGIQPSPLYIAPYTPDPNTAIVTYRFDQPTIVTAIDVVQHVNGITQVEGFLGNSLDAMVSLGSVFGPSGDVTDNFVVPYDGTVQRFSFNNIRTSGTIFQLVVRKTCSSLAFATYRIYPADQNGNRIPTATGCGEGEADTTPPTIDCPEDLAVSTDAGACDAVVNFTVTANDDSGNVSVVCNPPSGSTFPKGTTSVNCTATDAAGNTTNCNFNVTVNAAPGFAPAIIWVGLKNSDAVGIRFDLRAEVYRNGTQLIATGELASVPGGSSGFNNAKQNTITLTPLADAQLTSGETLSITLLVRNACTGSGKNSGTARLWFGDSAANSQFGMTNCTPTTYFLQTGVVLGNAPGTSRQHVDVAAGPKCSAYKAFGTWSVTVP